MGISWKKASSNPAGQKNNNHGNSFLENRDFIEKASDNPAVKKHPWKLYGTCMEHSWKIVDDVWESSCGNFISLKKTSNNPAGPKKKHGNSMQHAWKIHGKSWMMSGKVPVEGSWEFPGNLPATTACEKNNHGHFIQRSSEELKVAI